MTTSKYEAALLEDFKVQLKNVNHIKDINKLSGILISLVITAIGVAITNDKFVTEFGLFILGIVTAVLGSLVKLWDPTQVAENARLRKRILELLIIEGQSENPRYTEQQARHLVSLAKHDAQRIYESVLSKVMPQIGLDS